MADKDISIESGSDTGVEKRDYPGNRLSSQVRVVSLIEV
jgi:hypothetical protein